MTNTHLKKAVESITASLVRAMDDSESKITKIEAKDFTKLEMALMREMAQMTMVIMVSLATQKDNHIRLEKLINETVKCVSDISDHVDSHCDALHEHGLLGDEEKGTIH